MPDPDLTDWLVREEKPTRENLQRALAETARRQRAKAAMLERWPRAVGKRAAEARAKALDVAAAALRGWDQLGP